MNVLVFFDNLPPDAEGGAGVKAKFIIEQLIKNKCTPLVYSSLYDRELYSGLAVNSSFSLLRQRKHFRNYVLRLFFECASGVWIIGRLLFSEKKKIDVAFLSVPSFFTVWIIALFLRFKGVPYVIDLRDLYPWLLYKHFNLHSVVERLADPMLSAYLLNARKVFVPTREMQETLKTKYQIDAQLVFNGFQSDFLKIRPNKFKKPTVICHGGYGAFFDTKLFVCQIKNFHKNGWRVIVVGHGQNFDSLVEQVGHFVVIRGSMPMNKLAKIIARCHVGLSFRTSDAYSQMSFPLRVWDYIGLGVYVMISPKNSCSAAVSNAGLGTDDLESFDFGRVPTVKDKHIPEGLFCTREAQAQEIVSSTCARSY